LCVRYSCPSGREKAEAFNELAAVCNPDFSGVRHNWAVFQSLPGQASAHLLQRMHLGKWKV